MPFTAQDKEFIQLLIQGVNARIDSTHDNLNDKIDYSIKLGEKTNGRVTKLETWQTEHRTRDEGREKMNAGLKWVVVFLLGIITLLFGNNIMGNKPKEKTITYEKIDGETIIKLRAIDSTGNGKVLQGFDTCYWNDEDNPVMEFNY